MVDPVLAPEDGDGGTKEISIRRIELFNLLIIAAAAIAAWFYEGKRLSLAIIFGGLLAAASFRVVAMVVTTLLEGGSSKGKGFAAFVYWLKFMLTFALVGVAVLYLKVNVGGLLIGLSLIVFAIIIETLFKLLCG